MSTLSHRSRPMWLMIGVALSASLVACAGDNGGQVAPDTSASTEPPASSSTTPALTFGAPALIETRVINAARHVGVVLGTSVIGESPFCRGGKASGGSEGATITTTFDCPGGTLRVRYSPTQRSLVQGALWEVVTGTGSLAGLRGGGSMVAIFDEDHPDSGREVFTGTVGK